MSSIKRDFLEKDELFDGSLQQMCRPELKSKKRGRDLMMLESEVVVSKRRLLLAEMAMKSSQEFTGAD